MTKISSGQYFFVKISRRLLSGNNITASYLPWIFLTYRTTNLSANGLNASANFYFFSPLNLCDQIFFPLSFYLYLSSANFLLLVLSFRAHSFYLFYSGKALNERVLSRLYLCFLDYFFYLIYWFLKILRLTFKDNEISLQFSILSIFAIHIFS